MKERQRKLIPWILTALVIGAVVFIVNILSNSGLRDSVERRAFNDLSVSVEAQSAYLHNSWDQHYASLESLAYYIGQLEDFDIKKESDLLNSVAKAQKMCTLGYAGLNGEAVNYDGKYIGNISDREYFIEALSDRDARAISYLETALNSDEEQFVFALPVIRDNDIVGVVFASKEMELFISSFFGDTFNGKGYVFICDNKGNMILSYGEAAEHVPEDNYFAGYTDEMIVSDTSKDEILNSMASGKSGKYIGQHNGKKEYVVFAPLDINDWYIFNIIDVDTANATYENDHRLFSITLLHVVWAFLLMIVWIVVSTIIQQRSIKKEAERYRSQYKITESIFSDMNVAMYKVDLLTGELSITDTFEAMTGYTVPKDLMKSLNVYSASFPDFDFQKGLDLINTVRLEGKVVRYEFDLKTKRGAKKRIELSIHPFYDNKGVIVAIFGLLSDI
ncbi:MAG: PAS domain S-box protein, partial [Clostridiales bacterium]|nr:PAS domain S-box protein [Clostridiales bacterium]